MEQTITGRYQDTLEECFGAVGQAYTSPTCHLFARETEPKPGRRHVYLYNVSVDGDLVITDSPDPETDLARALLSRGMTGHVTLSDGITGKPRTIINIEDAAKLSTSEPSARRARFVPYVAE